MKFISFTTLLFIAAAVLVSCNKNQNQVVEEVKTTKSKIKPMAVAIPIKKKTMYWCGHPTHGCNGKGTDCYADGSRPPKQKPHLQAFKQACSDGPLAIGLFASNTANYEFFDSLDDEDFAVLSSGTVEAKVYDNGDGNYAAVVAYPGGIEINNILFAWLFKVAE